MHLSLGIEFPAFTSGPIVALSLELTALSTTARDPNRIPDRVHSFQPLLSVWTGGTRMAVLISLLLFLAAVVGGHLAGARSAPHAHAAHFVHADISGGSPVGTPQP